MTKTWINTVQNNYKGFNDLVLYDFWNIAERCGFETAGDLWDANPIIGGSVNPVDFGLATVVDIAKLLVPYYKEAIVFTENYEEFEFSEEAEEKIEEQLVSFLQLVGIHTLTILVDYLGGGLFLSLFAHDFWLTRNGHGAGFWDREEWGKYKDILTEKAKSFGESYVEVDDDNYLIYII